MPELLEVEQYRRLAVRALERPIVEVETPDGWWVRGSTTGADLREVLVGDHFVRTRRIGKLLLLDLAGGATVGLRFGMTGRLLLDGVAAIERLEYASARDDPAWDRFVVRLGDGGVLRVRDPRRLGGVELDPDEAVLGPDAWELTPALLAAQLESAAPLKARLLDQRRVAGIGNLLADEILWRAGLDPARRSDGLAADEIRGLHGAVFETLRALGARGGSHTGDLQPQRTAVGRCPLDGSPLRRTTVGGRTTFWCPAHQR